MTHSWLVVLPPLVVLASIVLTKRMLTSFWLGIVLSALIVNDFQILPALHLSITKFISTSGIDQFLPWQTFVASDSLNIFLFLIMLGILISLIQHSGASLAFTQLAHHYVHSKKSVEISSLLFSLVFFFDDYSSALTVGAVMRPLAHAYKLHPVKLAFLTTIMASPLVLVSPISTWIGNTLIQLKQSGIGSSLTIEDPFSVFLQATPYFFYSIFVIVSAWYIVLKNVSYGPMKHYDLTHDQSDQATTATTKAHFIDFIIPIMFLIVCSFISVLYSGGHYWLGGNQSLFDAIRYAKINLAFFIAGTLTLCFTTVYFLLRRIVVMPTIGTSIIDGTKLMLPSILMLTHAWTFSALLKDDLRAGTFIAAHITNLLTPGLMPLICFVAAALIAGMIGSAWATMSIMMPLALPLLQFQFNLAEPATLSTLPLVLPVIAAVFSGSIAGTHFSFISDNPILSSASTGAPHREHVSSLAWYALPPLIAAAGAYAIVGLLWPLTGLLWATLLAYGVGILLVRTSIAVLSKAL